MNWTWERVRGRERTDRELAAPTARGPRRGRPPAPGDRPCGLRQRLRCCGAANDTDSDRGPAPRGARDSPQCGPGRRPGSLSELGPLRCPAPQGGGRCALGSPAVPVNQVFQGAALNGVRVPSIHRVDSAVEPPLDLAITPSESIHCIAERPLIESHGARAHSVRQSRGRRC